MPDSEQLTPPQALLAPLDVLNRAFSRVLPDTPIVMGGGSVLAARWDHRQSTDIDLFVSAATMNQLINENRLRYFTLPAHLQETGQVRISPTSGFLSGAVLDTPCTLAASEFIEDVRPATHVIESTRFQAATNQEVLSGKLQGRMHRRHTKPATAPIRDLYDIVLAAHLNPGLVDTILQGITPKGRTVIANDLRLLPDNLHEIDPKPIISPQYDMELDGLPSAVADAIESGDETLLPNASRISQSSASSPGP